MAGTIVLAVAGAGKTYYICKELDFNKRNLILAFTHENIHNINENLCKIYGCIPPNTVVMTFDSFVFNQIILPFEQLITRVFGVENFHNQGITTVNPPSQCIKKYKKWISNPHYKKQSEFEHYNIRGSYYCSNLSELAMYANSKNPFLVDKICERISMFFDHAYVDEFQDFRLFEYDLLVALSKRLDMTVVGDFYQHSVSGVNNHGRPFKKGKKDISYEEYIQLLTKEKFQVLTDQLKKSRRCSEEVCNFVRTKLGIDIEADNTHSGKVKFISGSDIKSVLENDDILKLVYENANKYRFSDCNWSYSKGDTFNETCVILTKTVENLPSEAFDYSKISPITRNRLYVALTRSRGNVYIIGYSDFEKIKKEYFYR